MAFEGIEDQFRLHPAVDATVGANPRRKVSQAAAPAGQITEHTFDVVTLPEQLPTEMRFRMLQQFDGSKATRCLSFTTFGESVPATRTDH